MKTQIIRVDAYDDAVSIRDKLAWSKAGRILLVIPRRRPPRLTRLDLTLLQRSADQVGGQLGLVTIDPDLAMEARDAGIPSFPSVPAAQKMGWHVITPRLNRFQPAERDFDEKRERLQSQPQSILILPTWLRWLSFIIGAAAVLALALFFLPSASVELSPDTTQQDLTIPVRASMDVPGVLRLKSRDS